MLELLPAPGAVLEVLPALGAVLEPPPALEPEPLPDPGAGALEPVSVIETTAEDVIAKQVVALVHATPAGALRRCR